MRPPNHGEIEALARFESELAGLRAARTQEEVQSGGDSARDLAASPWRANADTVGDDWDLLLGAIKARLRIAAAGAPGQRPQGNGGSAGSLILECVDALDLLQLMLRQKLAYLRADTASVSRRGPAGSAGPLPSAPRLQATAPAGAGLPAAWRNPVATGSMR